MNVILWILQSLMAFVFLHAGICKTFYPKKEMAYLGQSGVVGLPLGLIRTVGIFEILGAYGLVIPLWLNILPVLTPIAALCFCVIMVSAMVVNYNRKKYKGIAVNIVLFLVFLYIFLGRTVLDH